MAKNDKKELLITTAINLFYKKRYLDTSIRDIGEAAKVNPSLVYHYFKDKEEILLIIIDRYSRHLINSLKEIQSREPDPLEGLRKMIFRHVFLSREFTKEGMITLEENSMLKGKRRTECLLMQRQVYEIYKNQLEHVNQVNKLEVNITVLCFMIFGMINWFYRWCKVDKPLTDEDVANQMVKIILSGAFKNK